ncbi:MAG: 2,3-bisphosphoglycerate-independent phosphoglycerate mutase [Candidatus Hadarchaeota archaeon]|nr:2,3-bisphosphoglycerate-independent phosphoglycerate mutase [Candidatus Hadarchaeota archaeon]
MKSLLIIADGLGGRPTDYKGKTCLEAANTPNLDELARRGSTGLLDSIGPGVRPGSDTAHLSIFGYDPEKVYTGRGVFETLGIGMDVREGDISFRTNFATVDENFILRDRRAGRIQEGQEELEKALQGLKPSQPGVEVLFKTSTEHRGALILRGAELSDHITDADPHKTGVKVTEVKPTTTENSAEKTAEIVNELVKKSHEILKGLPINKEREREGKPPANILLLRGASMKPDVPSIEERYGVKGVAIAAGALYIGVARALGLEFKRAEGVTGRADSPIINKAKLAVRELKGEVDFTFVHMKGTDSCAHDHDAEGKIAFIEKIDEVIKYFLDNLDWDETNVAFTGDHTTPIVYGDHVSDPVPIVFAGPNVVPDEVDEFNERSVLRGGIGRISGQILPILLGYSNRLKKFGT